MPDAGARRPLAALDLASLVGDDIGARLAELHWPTPYGDYAFLSRDLVERVVAAGRAAASSEEIDAVVQAKLYDIVTDLAVIGRLALDLRNTRASARTPLYDPRRSVLLRFLDEEARDPSGIAATRIWHHRKAAGALAAVKRTARRWRSDLAATWLPKSARNDVFNHNTLLDEYMQATGARWIDVSPNTRDWPVPDEVPAPVRDAAAALVEAFRRAAEPAVAGEPGLAASAHALAAHFVEYHLAKAWHDLAQVRRLVTARRAGEVLAGGAPKHIGRLFAWQYRRLGRSVHRFAHGGERAFFDDYAWGLAELPFCDRYHCHGRGEAANVARRHADGRTVLAGPAAIEFVGLGSRRHQAIRARAVPRRGGASDGTVMYVAGGYLGESLGDYPARKPPDVLYLDWQVRLLETLGNLGWRVVTKVHPGGVHREAALLARWSDEVVSGIFDPAVHAADCYVFDFAGTAFFDALASSRGVVLVDMGVRPIDAYARADLEARCAVVSCDRDERNRFCIAPERLREAVERASRSAGCPDAFFATYFEE